MNVYSIPGGYYSAVVVHGREYPFASSPHDHSPGKWQGPNSFFIRQKKLEPVPYVPPAEVRQLHRSLHEHYSDDLLSRRLNCNHGAKVIYKALGGVSPDFPTWQTGPERLAKAVLPNRIQNFMSGGDIAMQEEPAAGARLKYSSTRFFLQTLNGAMRTQKRFNGESFQIVVIVKGLRPQTY